MIPLVTIDGAEAHPVFAWLVEQSRARMLLHNGCPTCTSPLYARKPHAARCPTRMLAESLFGWLGGPS